MKRGWPCWPSGLSLPDPSLLDALRAKACGRTLMATSRLPIKSLGAENLSHVAGALAESISNRPPVGARSQGHSGLDQSEF